MKQGNRPKEKSKKKNKRQTSIITVILWLFLVATMITITLGGIKKKNAVVKSELYDKIYVESATIEERKTGTGPFTTREDGTIPDVPEAGMDYSEDDNYVRTFDTVNYTVSTIMRPNLDVEGVEETSVFYGGTIKVKATIPEVDGESYFKWIQQAWMQNVKITDDGRTLYAEYKIADSQKSAPGVQNLNFEMKAQGYVTPDGEQAPKPTFEIYMEGNREENEDSTKEKVIVTDEKELYITGRPAFNVKLVKGDINYPGIYNGKQGYYMNYGIGIELKQDVEEINDLRGLEYPSGEVSATLDLEYYYNDLTNNSGWIRLEDNGIEVVGYDVNYNDNEKYFPTKTIRINAIPYAQPRYDSQKWWTSTITDSGIMYLEKAGGNLNIKFDNYIIDGYFQSPDYGLTVSDGYFVVGQIEIFATNFDNESNINYDYQITSEVRELKLSTPTKHNLVIPYENSTLQDIIKVDNKVSWKNSKGGNGGKINSYVSLSNDNIFDSSSGINGTTSVVIGNIFNVSSIIGIQDVYYGGVERIVSWRSDLFALQKNKKNEWATIAISNEKEGDDVLAPYDNITLKYGVYKEDPSNGLITDELVEKADFEDFEWYNTKEDAEMNGKISSIYMDDPDHIGYNVGRYISFVLKATDDNQYILDNYIFKQKVRAYKDVERNNITYLGYDTYNKTEYDDNGILKKYHDNIHKGNNILLIPYHVSVTTSVEELASDNKPKTSYDVQEREIHFNITPILSTEKETTDKDAYVDKVQVVDYLPKGLTYVEGSADKEPVSVTLNEETGITEIVWEYENWQINHEAPEYPNITFQAEMSYTLKNNEKLTNKVIISTEKDWSMESTRTGSYGITIVNLAGLGVEKTTDTPVVEVNSDVRFNTEIVSVSDKGLTNIRMLDILPYNSDENGTAFTGTYTLKEVNIPDDIIGYYTTLSLDKLETDGGIARDQNNKLSAVNVDLENNSNWVKIEEGKVAENTTAIIFVKEVLTSGEKAEIGYTILPSGNKAGNIYGSSVNVTLDNFTGVVKSNIQVDRVIERKISGKVFEDKNQNGLKEETEGIISGIEVRLLNSDLTEAVDVEGNKVESIVTDENGYYEFENLPKGEYIVEFVVDGEKYEATKKLVGEDKSVNSNINSVENNSAKTDILTKLNTTEMQETVTEGNINAGLITYIDIEGVKKWEDNANEPNKRPESINLILYADGIENEIVEINETSNWRTVFKKKLKYDSNGKEIEYTIDEDYSNKFYEKSISGNVITNTFKVSDEKVQVEIIKVWEDEENEARKRPSSIDLIVKKDGTEVARETISDKENWKYTFELPKYDRLGNEIEYTVDEEIDSKFYVKEIVGNVITNRFVVPDDKIEIPVEKIWNDNNNEALKRPSSVKVIVKAKGETVTEYVLNEENDWKYTFNLAKYDELGDEIEYTIDEELTSIFYEKEIVGSVITNTFKVPDEKVKIEVLKVWDDNENIAEKRPSSVVLQVKSGGVVVASEEVTEEMNWKYEFELPKYDSLGNEIEYTVDEEEIDSKFYIKEIVGKVITNKFVVPEDRIELKVNKEWVDNNDKYGKRPESVTVQIVAKGEVVSEYAVSKADNWTYTFELPKYDSLGNEVKYSIVEKEVRDYDTVIEGNKIVNICTYEPLVDTSDKNVFLYLVVSLIAIIGVVVGISMIKNRKIN